MSKFGIGQPVRRVEDQRLITGQGRFTDDINLPDQAYLYVLRSPTAHARIAKLDVGAYEHGTSQGGTGGGGGTTSSGGGGAAGASGTGGSSSTGGASGAGGSGGSGGGSEGGCGCVVGGDEGAPGALRLGLLFAGLLALAGRRRKAGA